MAALTNVNGPAARERPGPGHQELTLMPEQAYKRCSMCGQRKPVTDFNRNANAKDGLQVRCHPCQVESNRDWRRLSPEKARAAGRRWREKHAGVRREQKARYRKIWPEKEAAWKAVEAALMSGRLVRPDSCEVCGSVGKIQAHHPDYSQRLEVLWLCARCHSQQHHWGGR